MLPDGGFELFNLDVDVSETKNLAVENPKVVEELLSRFTEIVKEGRSTPGAAQAYVRSDWPQLSWIGI